MIFREGNFSSRDVATICYNYNESGNSHSSQDRHDPTPLITGAASNAERFVGVVRAVWAVPIVPLAAVKLCGLHECSWLSRLSESFVDGAFVVWEL